MCAWVVSCLIAVWIRQHSLHAVRRKFTRPACRAAAAAIDDICCPRPTSAANPPAAAAAVDRRDRQIAAESVSVPLLFSCRPTRWRPGREGGDAAAGSVAARASMSVL